MNRYRDWLEQAKANLGHAQRSLAMGDYAWACFAAHQAAEAAAKALHMKHGQVAWGHSVTELLLSLPEHVRPSPDLLNTGRALDRHYVPTRCPHAHPAGPAFAQYTEAEAQEALTWAAEVVEYCEHQSLAN